MSSNGSTGPPQPPPSRPLTANNLASLPFTPNVTTYLRRDQNFERVPLGLPPIGKRNGAHGSGGVGTISRMERQQQQQQLRQHYPSQVVIRGSGGWETKI